MRITAAILSLMMWASAHSVAAAMTFERVTGGQCAERQCVQARGPIDSGSVAALVAITREARLSEGAIVFLDSLGGDHVAGIALGRQIRKRGFDTFVAAADGAGGFTRSDCASACVYMFVGGVRRGAAEDSRVGVHQIAMINPRSAPEGVTNAQQLMGLAAEHIQDMGANPQLLSLALKTPSQGMYWLSRRELRTGRAITLDVGLAKRAEGLGALSFFDATR
jgi:hypothetical protein